MHLAQLIDENLRMKYAITFCLLKFLNEIVEGFTLLELTLLFLEQLCSLFICEVILYGLTSFGDYVENPTRKVFLVFVLSHQGFG